MKLIIGCPVYKRAWILPTWFKFIEQQTMPLSDIGFVFELGTDDDETHNVLWEWQLAHPEVSVFDAVVRDDINHETHPKSGRQWTGSKYWRMVDLRNSLLDRVMSHEPQKFFSLDSDILLEHPETLERLFNMTEHLDAVGILSYMKPGTTQYPSVMSWVNGVGNRARRADAGYPIGTIFRSDIIMAAVMMSKKVYENTKYQWHKQGEDLGWSAYATQKGYELWCASNVYGAHIMHEDHLEPYLLHGDSRSTNIFG